jgi:hypothetical protein
MKTIKIAAVVTEGKRKTPGNKRHQREVQLGPGDSRRPPPASSQQR